VKLSFAFLCFGDRYYFNGTHDKLKSISGQFDTVVLTDDPQFFVEREYCIRPRIIEYRRNPGSYHDKMLAIRESLIDHDVCISMDADLIIKDWGFLESLSTYEFRPGISYVKTLADNILMKRQFKELPTDSVMWKRYSDHCLAIYPELMESVLVWEYFMAFKRDEMNFGFYDTYNDLQAIKESCDVESNNRILGPGEGVTMTVSAALNGVPLSLDERLRDVLDKKVLSISRQYLPESLRGMFSD
jgi:hypothetical protein